MEDQMPAQGIKKGSPWGLLCKNPSSSDSVEAPYPRAHPLSYTGVLRYMSKFLIIYLSQDSYFHS